MEIKDNIILIILTISLIIGCHMQFPNIFNHLKKIIIHKFYVCVYCWKLGLIWQGLTHDLSKFSPIEFIESVKYYQGTMSPIDICKCMNGYSNAWLHHKGRNKHHYLYWIDELNNELISIEMPKKYLYEMLCDYIGAGKAYMGKNFSFKAEFDWWKYTKEPEVCGMNPNIKKFINESLSLLAYDYPFNKETIDVVYNRIFIKDN